MNPGPTAATAERLAPGTRVGRYHLLRRLAVGGMAELHLACAEGVGGFRKVVVLKRVLPHLAADPDFVRLFLNEARLAATLDHPNVVQVIDIGEADGEYFYVMEYVHGRNVRELLSTASHRGGMPLQVALTIAVGAASALHHAHEGTDLEGRPLGIVHRDVSPSNVLVSYDGAVKLTDFGIAKAAALGQETIGGAMKGKIGYMSPEQCRGEPVDRRSDVFALGVVLFELTTCERLFFADNDFAVLNRVINGRFDPPSSRVPDYPPALERIVMRALVSDPEERYASAAALRADLEAFAHEARLRCTSAVLAGWMLEVFGRPSYPRVELQAPVAEDPAEAAPTLVLVSEERIVDTVPSGATVVSPSPRPRKRAPWLAVVAAAACLAGIAAWQPWASTNAHVPRASPARETAAQHGVERAHEPTSAPVPTLDEREPQPETPPQPEAPLGLAAAVEDRKGADPPASNTAASDTERDATNTRARARPRRHKRKKSATPSAPPRDLDALYPVTR